METMVREHGDTRPGVGTWADASPPGWCWGCDSCAAEACFVLFCVLCAVYVESEAERERVTERGPTYLRIF